MPNDRHAMSRDRDRSSVTSSLYRRAMLRGDEATLLRRRVNHFQPHLCQTRTHSAEPFRRAHRKIDDTAVDKGSAVVDAHLHALAALKIGHLEPGVER